MSPAQQQTARLLFSKKEKIIIIKRIISLRMQDKIDQKNKMDQKMVCVYKIEFAEETS